MFIRDSDAEEFLRENGFFIARSGSAGTRKSVVCIKTGENSFIEVANPNKFEDKVKQNILLDTDESLLVEIDLEVWNAYDAREREIRERKAILKKIKKNKRKFLSFKNALIVKGYGRNFYVVNLDDAEAKPIDADLIELSEVFDENKETVMQCLNDRFINQNVALAERMTKRWNMIKVSK